jgi:hypothetical protein
MSEVKQIVIDKVLAETQVECPNCNGFGFKGSEDKMCALCGTDTNTTGGKVTIGHLLRSPIESKRFAASYNACRSLSTEALEAGVVEKMVEYIKKLGWCRKQSRCTNCDCELSQILKLLEGSK